jgi:hypothetical protein
MSDDIQLLQNAMGLMRSISMDERTALIQRGHHNAQLQALAVAAVHAVLGDDANALRTLLDTAFCLGARSQGGCSALDATRAALTRRIAEREALRAIVAAGVAGRWDQGAAERALGEM